MAQIKRCQDVYAHSFFAIKRANDFTIKKTMTALPSARNGRSSDLLPTSTRYALELLLLDFLFLDFKRFQLLDSKTFFFPNSKLEWILNELVDRRSSKQNRLVKELISSLFSQIILI